MKAFFLFIFCISFSFSVFCQDKFKAGLKAGLSASQVAGDTYAGFNKAGFVGGGFVRASFNEKWSCQFEILFNQKGSRYNGNPEKQDFTFYLLKLNYIEVPVLFQYHQKKFIFEIGPGIGVLTSIKEYNENGPITTPNPFITTEFSIHGGISYNLLKNLDMEWRYSNSLNAIRKHSSGASFWWNPGQQNVVLTFALTYWFGKDGTVD